MRLAPLPDNDDTAKARRTQRTGSRPPTAGRQALRPLRLCGETALTGAHTRIRTGDLILTKDALCQLSYVGPLIRTQSSAKHGLPAVARGPDKGPKAKAGGRGRSRTSVGIRRQIYSLFPLATRAPAPETEAAASSPARDQRDTSMAPDQRQGWGNRV